MTEQEIQKIDDWIDNIITTQKTMPGVDGYILKHILQEEAGIYLTLPEFEKMSIVRMAKGNRRHTTRKISPLNEFLTAFFVLSICITISRFPLRKRLPCFPT